MSRSILGTAIMAAALGTCAFSQGEVPFTPPATSPEEKAAAQRIWDRMIEAKGGRERLHNVETLVLEARQYLVFPIFSGLKNGEEHTMGVYAFPDRAWGWQDSGKTVFLNSASTMDLSQGVHYIVYAGDDIRKSDNFRGGEGALDAVQLIYLNETRWFLPLLSRVLPAKGIPRDVDGIETYMSGKRVDFWIKRKDHLVSRIREYTRYSWLPPSRPYVIVENALSDYREIDGIQIPHKVLLTLEGRTHASPRMSFKLNVKLRGDLFSKPPRFEDGPEAWKAPE